MNTFISFYIQHFHRRTWDILGPIQSDGMKGNIHEHPKSASHSRVFFFVGLRICEQRGLPRRGWQHRITSSFQVLRSSIRAQITPKMCFPLAFGKSYFLVQSWFRTLAAFGWAANIFCSISLTSDHGICEATMALIGKQRFQFPAVQGQPWMSCSQSVTSC